MCGKASVALACKGPLNARLATGVGLSFFLSFLRQGHGRALRSPSSSLPTNLDVYTPLYHETLTQPARTFMGFFQRLTIFLYSRRSMV